MNYNYKYDSIVFITNQGDKYYVNQLCDMFCVTPETIMKWADNGELGNKIYEKMSSTDVCSYD